MNAITELDLIDAIRNKWIQQFRIVQTERITYRIVVTLARMSMSSGWKDDDFELTTKREVPREWTSLDRLIRHVRSRYGAVPAIGLALKTEASGRQR